MTYGEWQDALSKAEERIAKLEEALEIRVDFIQDAPIIEAQWSWEPIKTTNEALKIKL